MASLAHQRCFHHGHREAVARCPSCARFYCRECIAEHSGRVLCAACLKLDRRLPASKGFARVGAALALLAGLFVAWLFFFSLGMALLSIPSSFHSGAVWTSKWLE